MPEDSDNIATEQTPDIETSNTVGMSAEDRGTTDAGSAAVEESKNNEANEFDYVPSKFMSEGQPDFEKMANSYTELEKQFSNGVPAVNVDEYNYEFTEGSAEVDQDAYAAFKEEAVKNGFSGKQFNYIMEQYQSVVAEVNNQHTQTPESAETALKEVWGDDYDSNFNDAIKAMDSFAPDGFDVDAIGNSPEILQLLAVIGSQIGEDKSVNTNTSHSSITYTEMKELMAKPDYFENPESQQLVGDYFKQKAGEI